MKICYNPNNKNYIQGSQSHNILLYNAKKQKAYSQYIRCILDGGILYIRVYYPFDNINSLTRDGLYQASYELLQGYTRDILALIKKHTGKAIKDIRYNVDRQYLENAGLYNL